MRRCILMLSVLLAGQAEAAEVVWRSKSLGVLPMLSSTDRSPTIPVDLAPGMPAEFSLSYSGTTSVDVGAAVDLRPVVAGASGAVRYLIAGTLPEGVTFAWTTGAFNGRAVVPGRYELAVMASDAAGAAASATVVVTVF